MPAPQRAPLLARALLLFILPAAGQTPVGNAACNVSVFAGSPTNAMGAANGVGTAILFSRCNGVSFDAAGTTLYVADYLGQRVRAVNVATRASTTIASGPLGALNGISTAVDGSVLVLSIGFCGVRKVTPAGAVSVFAGGACCVGAACLAADGPALNASFSSSVRAIAADAAGSVYVIDGNALRAVRPNASAPGTFSVAVLAGAISGVTGCTNGVGTNAQYNTLGFLAVSSDGATVYHADNYCYTVRAYAVATGVVSTLAGAIGTAGFADGFGVAARFSRVSGLGIDPLSGAVYASDVGAAALRVVTRVGDVRTLVGNGTPAAASGSGVDFLTGAAARFVHPGPVVAGSGGTVYVADYFGSNVRAVMCPPPASSSQTPTPTSAATPSPTPQQPAGVFAGAAAPATTAAARMLVVLPKGLCLDGSAGVLFISRHCLRRVGLDGSAATLAGDCASTNGVWSGDGGPATSATLNAPAACAAGAAGVYVAEAGTAAAGGGRVRLLNATSGRAETVAGNGSYSTGAPLAGVAATAQPLGSPAALALGADGATLYIADGAANAIYALAPGGGPGALRVFAGTNAAPTGAADAGDGGAATAARVAPAGGLALAPANAAWPGALYFTDRALSTVRAVLPNGRVIHIAGVPGARTTPSTVGLLANASAIMAPTSLAFDAGGALLVLEMLTAPAPAVRRVWPNGSYGVGWAGGSNNFDGNVGPAIAHYIASSLAYDAARAVGYVTESLYGRVRAIQNNVVRTLAGPWAIPAQVAGAAATSIELHGPQTIAFEPVTGALIVPEPSASLVRLVAPSGALLPRWVGFPLAASAGRVGTSGLAGDGGNATAATIQSPLGVAPDGLGGYFVAMSSTNGTTRVARVWANGTITTAVGGGAYAGSTACGGGASVDARAAGFSTPLSGLAWDNASQALYIVEQGAGVVRRWSAATNIVTVFAGTCGSNGLLPLAAKGNGGPATSARFYVPWAVAVDPAGNVLIAENFIVWLVNISNSSTITVIAGIGTNGVGGNGGPATAARLQAPKGIAFDSCGQLFFSDTTVIRRVSPYPGGTISQVPAPAFGTGFPGATSGAYGIAIDAAGRLFVVDGSASLVRVIPPGFSAACAPLPSASPTASPSATASVSSTATATPSPTPSSTQSAGGTACATLSTSGTASSSSTPSPTPTASARATPSDTPTASSTSSPTSTGRATQSPSGTCAPTPSTTPTLPPSAPPTRTATLSPGASASATGSDSGTGSTTKSAGATPTPTPSTTVTASRTAAPTLSQTQTGTDSASTTVSVPLSATATPSPMLSVDGSTSGTPSATGTGSSSPSPSLSSTLTALGTPSDTPTAGAGASATGSFSGAGSTTASAGGTPASTSTPTGSPSPTAAATPSETLSGSGSGSTTASISATPTTTLSRGASTSASSSVSRAATSTLTPSGAATASATLSQGASPSATPSVNPTRTGSASASPTRTGSASAGAAAGTPAGASAAASAAASPSVSGGSGGAASSAAPTPTPTLTSPTPTPTPSPSATAGAAGAALAAAGAAAGSGSIIDQPAPYAGTAAAAAIATLTGLVLYKRAAAARAAAAADREAAIRRVKRGEKMTTANPLRADQGRHPAPPGSPPAHARDGFKRAKKTRGMRPSLSSTVLSIKD